MKTRVLLILVGVLLLGGCEKSFLPRQISSSPITLDNASQLIQLQRVGKCVIERVAWSPKGDLLAVTTYCGILYLYDSATLLPTISFDVGKAISSIIFSPDGTKLAIGYADDYIKLWDANTGLLLHTFEKSSKGNAFEIAFSPDGQLLAAGGKVHVVNVWDTKTGQLLHSFPGNNTFYVYAIEFSPDGDTIAIGGDYGIELMSATTGDTINAFEYEGVVTELSFSLNGTIIVSNDGQVLDLEAHQIQNNLGELCGMVFTRDSNTIITRSHCCEDNVSFQVWNIITGQLIHSVELPQNKNRYPFDPYALSPNGETVVTVDKNILQLWSIETGQLLRENQDHISWAASIAFSHDGQMLAAGETNGFIHLWDFTNGRAIKTIEGHTGRVSSIVFSSDGKTLISGSWDKTVRSWDIPSGQQLSEIKTDGYITSIAISPDSKLIAARTEEQNILLWHTGKDEPPTLIESPVYAYRIAFNLDGKLLAVAGNNKIILWNTNSGELLHSLEIPKDFEFSTLVFSLDGKFLASGGIAFSSWEVKTIIFLWDTTSWELLQVLEGNKVIWAEGPHGIESIVFNPASDILASGGGDGVILLWTPANGQLLTMLDLNSKTESTLNNVNTLAFSPDGRYLASGSGDGTIRIWGLP